MLQKIWLRACALLGAWAGVFWKMRDTYIGMTAGFGMGRITGATWSGYLWGCVLSSFISIFIFKKIYAKK